MKALLRSMVRRLGYEVVNIRHTLGTSAFPPDFTPQEIQTYVRVRPYTQTTQERVVTMIRAVEHVVTCGITGDIVECGVWKGGSMMAAALTLRTLGRQDRRLHLFDTYAGMACPSSEDESRAHARWERDRREDGNDWNRASIEEVRGNLDATGYPANQMRFVKGPIQETLPAQAPDRLAVLRLDMDLHDPTRHALERLWPRLSPGGILIVDDYGDFSGCRKAVDDYVRRLDEPVFLSRIDASGRVAVKPGRWDRSGAPP